MKLDIERLEKITERYEELNVLLAQPQTLKDPRFLRKYNREQKNLENVVSRWQEYQKFNLEKEKTEELLRTEEDDEIKELAREEIKKLMVNLERITGDLVRNLAPKDKYSGRSIIMEIRAGTGGEEAALFAADLYKMYIRFAEKKKWRVENIHFRPTKIGGFKEIVFAIDHRDVFSYLRFESGVHRVQRVPATESSGRIHTSTVTVAVLPEAEEIEIEINPEELRTETFHSRGAGGQHVNVTDSAVRITHLPTGLVVQCQDERSQHQNRAKALRVLRAELLHKKEQEQRKEISQKRRTQIGKGERSERIRTYNFPQGRITDHRVGLTLFNLEKILEGELELLINPLRKLLQEEIFVVEI